jgi:hypothetical protein
MREGCLGLEDLALPMRARRLDANHNEVGDYLRALGWSVLELARHGVSVDMAVSKLNFAALVEVKDGSRPPSARQLTDEEKRLKANWQGPYIIALSPQDAADKLEAWRSGYPIPGDA